MKRGKRFIEKTDHPQFCLKTADDPFFYGCVRLYRGLIFVQHILDHMLGHGSKRFAVFLG